jgi:hypothetical protein
MEIRWNLCLQGNYPDWRAPYLHQLEIDEEPLPVRSVRLEPVELSCHLFLVHCPLLSPHKSVGKLVDSKLLKSQEIKQEWIVCFLSKQSVFWL